MTKNESKVLDYLEGMTEIIENMPAKDYHASEGVSASQIKHGDDTMLEMRHYITTPYPANKAMSWGSKGHIWVLQYDQRWDMCALYKGPTEGKGSQTELKAFTAANPDKEILKPDEVVKLDAMRESVYGKSYIARMIESAASEVSLFWKGNYGKAKCRFDLMGSDFFVDAKIVPKASINEKSFAWHIKKAPHKGHLQLGHYRTGFMSQFAHKPKCGFLAIAKDAPYDCALYWMDDTWVDEGAERAHEIACLYKACELSNRFDGVQTDGAEVLYNPDKKWDDDEVDVSKGTMEVEEL